MEPSRRSARARYWAETLILAVTMSQHAKLMTLAEIPQCCSAKFPASGMWGMLGP